MDSPGKRLRWAREHKTRYAKATDAANAFGWTVSTYLGHENGDRNPSRGAAKKYGGAYIARRRFRAILPWMDADADAPEVEITPEMIEAGFAVLQQSGITDDYLAADRLLPAEIFRAMWAASKDRRDRPKIAISSGMRIIAKFEPERRHDLKPDVLPMLGCTGTFEALWRIPDGPYRGQWAMRLPKDWPIETAAWVPETDLRPVA